MKQAPRAWYTDIDRYLASIGFHRSTADSNLYISPDVLLLLWVDDILIFASTKAASARVKKQLSNQYQMKDLGSARTFIGIEISRDRRARQITLCQHRYIDSILRLFKMHEAHGLSTPLDPNVKLRNDDDETSKSDTRLYQSQVGKLMYAMLGTRPDLAFTISTLARFNASPSNSHASAVKRTLRYLRSTRFHGLRYQGSTSQIIGYCDSDWAGDLDTRRSTSGYTFILANAAISWKSRRQPTVALSSTEAEYMAITDAAKEAIWIRRLYAEITGKKKILAQLIYPDNAGAKALAHNPKHHDRTKHIDIRYHYIRECIENSMVTLEYVPTADNTANILTKALPRKLHERHTIGLGVHKIDGRP